MTPSEYFAHPIRELLDRLLGLLQAQEFSDPDLLAQDSPAASLQSVSAISNTARSLLERTPPQFVSGHGLTQLQNAFQAIFNELTAYQSNKNPGHLQNARAQVEQSIMPQLWTFSPLAQQGDLAPLSQSIVDLTKTSSDSIQQLIAQREKYAAQSAALAQQIVDAEAKLARLAETVTKQNAEAASVVAVVQKQYAEKEAERVVAFESLLKQLRDNFAQMQVDAELAQAQRLDSLRESQDQAAQIVQVVGNIGVTGNYQKIANVEGEQANIWRYVTIGFFCAGIVIAAATFWKFWNQPFSPENAWSVLIRLMYAIAITAPAWYTARESARHRTNADRARQTELELASLGPFIELMPEDKKHQIREELTKRYFGNQVSEHTVEQPLNLKEVREFALELIKAARK
ncbi:hypothetical protein [Hydrogenophaga sp.]|uniref:hypothetical protein n=1 Tax=Hydrogenophaga sp. TaxID=1904254 RepID=UPI0035B02EAC